jgi:hypothetical protein
MVFILSESIGSVEKVDKPSEYAGGESTLLTLLIHRISSDATKLRALVVVGCKLQPWGKSAAKRLSNPVCGP